MELDAETIRSWHLARGWSDIGYHYVVKLDGTIESGRPLHRVGAHVKGHNDDSIGICYVGGLDAAGGPKNTLNLLQRDSIQRICYALCIAFNQSFELHAHNEYSNKACPSFDVADTFEELGDWCDRYRQRFRDQRPATSLECAQYRPGPACACGHRKHSR